MGIVVSQITISLVTVCSGSPSTTFVTRVHELVTRNGASTGHNPASLGVITRSKALTREDMEKPLPGFRS